MNIVETLELNNINKIIIFSEALCDLSIFYKNKNKLDLSMGDIFYIIEEILIIF